MAGRKTSTGTPIAEHEHVDDVRVNIPTVEQRDALVEDEQAPPPAVFKRNPALDPQLVWKGKYRDDRRLGEGATLEVSSLPIYIQEVVRPSALVDDLRSEGDADGQLDLFATKRRKLSDDQRFDFYQHEEDWQNRLILGDSLLVMTSLAEREGLRGKVQMIYMDPPYGIKFQSNWQARADDRDVKDGDVDDVAKDPEQIKAFRDTWKDGIHSYLSYLRDRLTVARELLSDEGSVFVQIGDENVHRVRAVMDEVFGEENFESLIIFSKTSGASGDSLAGVVDYVIWYAKDSGKAKRHSLYFKKEVGTSGASQYTWIRHADGSVENVGDAAASFQAREGVELFAHGDITSQRPAQGEDLREFTFQGRRFVLRKGTFKTDELGMRRLARARRLLFVGNTLRYMRLLKDLEVYPMTNLWVDTGTSGFSAEKVYVVQTNMTVVQRCLLMTTDPGDLVLDPTCGSGTTAMVAEQWGRRWITCDTSRVALTIARTRFATARLPYYLLADSDEGREKELQLTGSQPSAEAPQRDLRQGFVYERVNHVTLKSIANNDEIDRVDERWQPDLDAARAELNGHLPSPLEEWQIPRVPQSAWPATTNALLERWWSLQRERRADMDAAIRLRGETERLYDLPYSDPKRVRVAGPFTVESLSPHRVMPAGGELPESERTARARRGDAGFVESVLRQLRKVGIRNGDRKQRLEFERLDPYPGKWIQAMGEGKGGLHVAVCVGPEFGTVGQALIDEARREAEAARHVGALVVCGMAFEATLARDTSKDQGPDGFSLAAQEKRPRLEVFPVRMSPDLTRGMSERLKDAREANLFMVFGEPDLAVAKQPDGRYTVTLRGMDVYDPSTGVVRSGTAEGDAEEFKADDVACWMLDTAYDGRCFVVRQIYFPGRKDPYEKLRKALKAEINPSAWASLRGTTSRAFARPPSGTIAVKVINHYGDEALKVWRLP